MADQVIQTIQRMDFEDSFKMGIKEQVKMSFEVLLASCLTTYSFLPKSLDWVWENDTGREQI